MECLDAEARSYSPPGSLFVVPGIAVKQDRESRCMASQYDIRHLIIRAWSIETVSVIDGC